MAFSKKLSIGNRALDSEHKKLYEIIGTISRSLVTGDTAGLPESFDQLESRLHHYFEVEENIAQAVGFDFSRHRLSHQNLLGNIRRVRNKLLPEDCSLSAQEKSRLARTLSDCLVQHIIVDGKPFKIVLDTHYYDLGPRNPALA